MSPNPFDLTGKVALVTGAGTGIGRACALLYARHGADVILASRKVEPLEETARMVKNLGRRAVVIPTDVKVPEACEKLVSDGAAAMGRLDILLNCAGGNRARGPDGLTLKDYNDMIALNLTSVWALSFAASRAMREGGAIVNISSGASMRVVRHAVPYGLAKSGVNYLTSALAVEFHPLGIRVNCIASGSVLSEGYIRAAAKRGKPPGAGSSLRGRAGDPDEIAWPVLFLSCEASSYVTGQVLGVSGSPMLAVSNA